MDCIEKETYYGYYFQDWPENGKLWDHMNFTLDNLKNSIKDELEGGVHYTVRSIIPSETRKSFVQTGCGPNFEGGVLSQCTCRHDIRAKYYSFKDWESKWLAGFTGYGKNRCGASYLFYLMKVKKPVSSFKRLFDYYKEYDEMIIIAKRSDKNPLGDLYVPISDEITDENDPDQYLDACKQHSHYGKTGKLHDINYPKYTEKCKKRRVKHQASLLLGDPELSFLWNKPMMQYIGGKAPRHGKWDNIQDLLRTLEPVSEVTLPKFKKKRKSREITC